MASQSISCSILLLVLLLYRHSNSAMKMVKGADEALLDNICKQAESYDFCISTLRNDRRTAAADLHGLALISISITTDVVRDVLDVQIPNVLKNATLDPVDKQRIQVCQSDYRDALDKFTGAYNSSSERSYWDVINRVRDGANKAINCEDIYRRNDPIRVSPVSNDNRNVIKLAEISLIIVDSLVRQ